MKITLPTAVGLALIATLSAAQAQPMHGPRNGPPGWSSAPQWGAPPPRHHRGYAPPPPQQRYQQQATPVVGQNLSRGTRFTPVRDLWRYDLPRPAYGTTWGRTGNHLVLVSDRDYRVLRVIRLVG